jgi:tRNA pseudouridine55 synthase
MYSALKRGGVPLYRLARSGVEVERQPRRVRIEELTIERYDWPELQLLVRCSKGTYVRTLVEDVARAAGTVGHVAALRRLAVSPFEEQLMRSFADLEAAAAEGALERMLLPADAGIQGWPLTRVGPVEAARLTHGQPVAADPALPCGQVRVYAESGGLVAIGVVTPERQLEPKRVFIR